MIDACVILSQNEKTDHSSQAATDSAPKNIRVRLHYFGKWEDRKTALVQYNAQHGNLEAGRTPRPRGEEFIEVETACEVYLDFIEQRIEEGELEPQQYGQKYRTLEKFKIAIGKHSDITSLGPLDFQDANKALKTRQDGARASVSYHKDENNRVRTFLKWCLKDEIILQPPPIRTTTTPSLPRCQSTLSEGFFRY